MERRYLLGALATGVTGVLAGCSSDDDPTEEDPVGTESGKKVPAPTVTLPDGWKVTTEDTESRTFASGSVSFIDWKAVGHTKRYENKDLRDRITEETFGKFTSPLVVGFATRIELDVLGGDITELIVKTATDEIETKAKSEFEKRLNEFGLKQVHETGTIERGDRDKPSEFTQYEGKYSVEPITVEDVDIPNVEKDSFTLKGGELLVEGLLAVWRANGHIFVAGGVYPAEDYRRSKQWDITGGVHLTLEVEMGLSRAEYLAEVVQFSRSIRA